MALDPASRQPAISMECVNGGACLINQAGYNCASVASKLVTMHEFAGAAPSTGGCARAVIELVAADASARVPGNVQTGGAL